MSSYQRTLYIGVTNDLERRVFQHKTGAVPGFTSKYRVTRSVYCEETNDPTAAIEREKQLKGWLRRKKIALIESTNPRWLDLAADWFTPDDLRVTTEKSAAPNAPSHQRSLSHPGLATRGESGDSSSGARKSSGELRVSSEKPAAPNAPSHQRSLSHPECSEGSSPPGSVTPAGKILRCAQDDRDPGLDTRGRSEDSSSGAREPQRP
jgi:putative endonuclease